MTEERKGELFIAVEAFLWAFFPVITALSYARIPALVSLAWCSLLAGVFFGALVTYRNRWHEFRQAAFWFPMVGIVLITGTAFYVLYFTGLEYTTPGNASIIALSEIFFAYLFFNVHRRESFSRAHVFGAACMVVGALVVVGRNWQGVNVGDILILCAALIAPVGNLFQRQARAVASSESIMFVRSFASSAVIFMLAALLGKHAPPGGVLATLPYLLVNGILILGLSKFFWIEAIHRISVTKCNALNSLTPLLTLLIAWALLGQQPTLWQVSALVPMLLGVLLLTDQVRLPSRG